MFNNELSNKYIYAAVPVFSYLCVASFEYGYALYFGIDSDFVVVDFQRVLLFTFTVSSYLLTIALLASHYFADELGLSEGKVWWKRFGGIISVFLLPLFLSVFVIPRGYAWVIYACLILAPVLSFVTRKIKLNRAISAQRLSDSSTSDPVQSFVLGYNKPLDEILRFLIGEKLSFVFLMFPGLLSICFVLGYTNASHRTKLTELQDNSGRYLLRVYGGTAILGSRPNVDSDKWDIFVCSIDALNGVPLRQSSIIANVKHPTSQPTTMGVNP